MGRGRRKSESLPKGEEVGTLSVKVEDGIGAFGLQEAPTFYPTEEEFVHPLQYIAQIRAQAEAYGICRIVPPASWDPPFGLDTVKFTFPTKLQAIHHLQERPAAWDADTFKLEYVRFLKKVGESVEHWPSLNGEELDLCKFFNAVKRYGGHAKVTLANKWAEVVRMVMAGASAAHSSSSAAPMLRELYEKHLSVFEMYQMKVGAGKRWRAKVKQEPTEKMPNKVTRAGKKLASGDSIDLDITGGSKRDEPADADLCEVLRPTPESETRSQSKRLGRRRKSGAAVDASVVASMLDLADDLSEVLRPSAQLEIRSQEHAPAQRKRRKTQDKFTIPDDLLGRTDQICEQCHSGAHEELMLLCDRCDRGWHLYCLSPPLSAVPVGNWYCLECLGSDSESFGFGQGQEYSFDSFRRMADRFRRKWMGTRPATHADIEREFWRVVEGGSAPVEVLYGSDLDTGLYGSGFPRLSDPIPSWSTAEGWDEGARNPWNVNNFPKLDGSMLRLVHDNIPGVMVPWLYIGMLFSAFCWHYEDHCFYSVNYLHCGEAKSWYSVPGSAADDFEKVMKSAFPDLFEAQPDLLFQLVTMLKPTVLRDNGVPVYMTVQEARNFVITFPRSYHGGFNHGFNCAEAVNFAPSDWLPYGGFGVERYRLYHKAAVLSHDELICVVAKNDKSCTKSPWLQQELSRIIAKERYQREYLWCLGMTKSSPMTPRPSSDHIGAEEDAECIICRYYLHLSAVVCRCRPGKAVCLQHARQLCECGTAQQTLMYRFTLAELDDLIGAEEILEDCKVGLPAPAPGSNKSRLRRGQSGPSSRNNSMMKKVKGRQYRHSELADTWLYQARSVARSHLRSTVLVDLMSQAEQFLWGGHEMDQVREMVLKLNATQMWVRDVVACSLAVERNGHAGSGKGSKVCFATVQKLVNVSPTPWAEPNFQKLKALYEPASKLELRIRDILCGSSDVEIRALQALQQEASSSPFDFAGLQQLKDVLDSAQVWCDRARKVLSCTKVLRNRSRLEETNLEQLQALQAAGTTVAVKCREKDLLEAAVSSVTSWQQHAIQLLASSCTKEELEDALKRSESLVIHLAEVDQLEERLRKVKSWEKRVRDALSQARSNIDYEFSMRTFEDLVQEGHGIQVHDLEEMDVLEREAQKVSWMHRASKTFYDYPTVSDLQVLVSEATSLQLSENPLALDLAITLKSASAWEMKAQHTVSSRGPLSMFQELASSGKTMHAKLPGLVAVTESVAQAERLIERAESFLGPSRVVQDGIAEENNLSALRCLVADIQSCPVVLDEEQAVSGVLSAAESWVSDASILKASVSVSEQSENQILCSLNRKADELDDTDERIIGPRPRKDIDTCRRLEEDLTKLNSAIAEGLALHVNLPEIKDLQSLSRATRWSLKAQDLLVDLPDLKEIESYLDEAIMLPRRPPEFSVLQRILREAKIWLQHASVFLSGRGAKGICRENQLVKLISDAQLLSVSMVTEAACLKDILETHRIWKRNIQAVISGTASLPFSILLRLQDTGSASMIHYEGEGVLNAEIYEASAWMERCSAGINVHHPNRKLSLEDLLLEMRCSAEFALRFLNAEGASSKQDLTCICRRPTNSTEGASPHCEFCGDWFHQSCIALRQHQMNGQKQNVCTYCWATSTGVLANNYALFRKIHVTQRPQLSLLRELLSAGQKFRCRIKEKEILDEVVNLVQHVERLVQVVIEEALVCGDKQSTEVSRPLVAAQKALEVIEVQTGQKESLRTVLAVKIWRSEALKLLNDPSRPSLRSLTKMLKDGQAIPVCEEDAVVKQLEKVEACAIQWATRAKEVMGDGGRMPLGEVQALAAEGEELPVNFVKELSALRERTVIYCVCREPYDEDRAMIACDQCGEWYHFSCINLPEPESSDEETDGAGRQGCVLAGEFVCPQCKEPSTRGEYQATAAIATDPLYSEQDSDEGTLRQDEGAAQFTGLVRGKRSRRSSNRTRGETLHKWRSPVYAPGKLLWPAQRKRKQHEQQDGSVSASGRPCRRTAGRHSRFESFVLLTRSR